ncbi:cytochrome P450 [Tanacetum coccineum]|uniref:Cytochrome P450 n=1 Tax=Tanacetum coccineum TaxID=301880 RepID=A0ABQ4Y846_9ASTR
MIPWNTNTRTTKRLVWISIAGLPSQLWHSDNFTSIAEVYGEILIKEDCSPRQFNITHGKYDSSESDGDSLKSNEKSGESHDSSEENDNFDVGSKTLPPMSDKVSDSSRVGSVDSPQPSNSAESVEVNKTVNIGNQLGFGMTGKEADVSSIVLQIVQFLGLQETLLKKDLWNNSRFETLEKKILWATLHNIITVNDCLTITLGDFNEVRNALERSGSVFHHRGAINFNDFISSSGLSDLPLGGLRYTRMDKLGSKLSKLDRFLVSPHVLDKCPSAHAGFPITSVTLRETLNNLDLKVESSPLSIIDINLRANSVKELLEIDQKRPKTSAKKQDSNGLVLSSNGRLK